MHKIKDYCGFVDQKRYVKHTTKTSPLHLLVFLSKMALVEIIVPYLKRKCF